MIYHSIFCTLASCSIGIVLMLCIYWKYMHATVDFVEMIFDAPHVLLICAIVGFIVSFL